MGTTTTAGSWLGDLWDAATGTFDKWIDYDSMKFDQRMAEDRYRWQAQQLQDNAPSQGSWSPVTTTGGMSANTILIGGAVLIGGFLVAKHLKLI